MSGWYIFIELVHIFLKSVCQDELQKNSPDKKPGLISIENSITHQEIHAEIEVLQVHSIFSQILLLFYC